MNDTYYSLLLDGSTDISTEKHVCVVVRYFFNTRRQLRTDMLGLLTLSDSTALGLYDKLIEFLRRNQIDLQKCIGTAADGASVMVGRNHSPFMLMKQDSLFLI
jgi:hypothetical protein